MPGETARELLAKALKRREELRWESEALDHIIETYSKLMTGDTSSRVSDQLDLWRVGTRRALQSAQVIHMLDEARRIILAEKRPMKRGELVTRLEAQGYQMVGGDKNKVFGTNLWRSGKFKHVEGQGYWPADVEVPLRRP